MLLTEGYDVDSAPTGVGIDCVAVLRPTRSRPLFAQMVGRGTRTAELKSNLLLLDFLWMHKKHRICRPASLVAKSDDEADSIMAKVEVAPGMPADVAGQLDLLEVAASASLEREEALRKKLAEAAKNKPTFISAEEFAMRHNSLAAAEYEPTMPWHSFDITDPQRKRLKSLKVDLATVKGRGHASELIGLHYSVPQPATPRQKGLLRHMGCPNWQTATAREAQRFFAQMKKGERAAV
jgi:type I site-specific restriction endonuclease